MADTRKERGMRPKAYETESYGEACLKLAEFIRERFVGVYPEEIVLDAMPVRRTSDDKRIATAVVAYPRGRSDEAIACLWRVKEHA
jgi:hypothetical protein